MGAFWVLVSLSENIKMVVTIKRWSLRETVLKINVCLILWVERVVSNCFTQFYPIIHIHPTFVFCSFPSLAGTGTIRLQSNHRHVIAMHGIEYWQGSAMRYNIHIKSCDLWWNGSRSEWMRHDTLPHVGWSCSVSSVATAIETYVPVAQCFAVLRPSRHALHTD